MFHYQVWNIHPIEYNTFRKFKKKKKSVSAASMDLTPVAEYHTHTTTNSRCMPAVKAPLGNIRSCNICYEAYVEWRNYLEEIIAAKRATTKSWAVESMDVDLISQLLKA